MRLVWGPRRIVVDDATSGTVARLVAERLTALAGFDPPTVVAIAGSAVVWLVVFLAILLREEDGEGRRRGPTEIAFALLHALFLLASISFCALAGAYDGLGTMAVVGYAWWLLVNVGAYVAVIVLRGPRGGRRLARALGLLVAGPLVVAFLSAGDTADLGAPLAREVLAAGVSALATTGILTSLATSGMLLLPLVVGLIALGSSREGKRGELGVSLACGGLTLAALAGGTLWFFLNVPWIVHGPQVRAILAGLPPVGQALWVIVAAFHGLDLVLLALSTGDASLSALLRRGCALVRGAWRRGDPRGAG